MSLNIAEDIQCLPGEGSFSPRLLVFLLINKGTPKYAELSVFLGNIVFSFLKAMFYGNMVGKRISFRE